MSILSMQSQTCKYCSFIAENREASQNHMIEEHEELLILHTMASQVNQIDDRFVGFSNILKKLFENQNAMKQELFLIRNNQAVLLSESSKKADLITPMEENRNNPEKKNNSEDKEEDIEISEKTNHTTPTSSSFAEAVKKPLRSQPRSEPKAPSSKGPGPSSSTPVSTSSPSSKQQVLFIGDSISANIDIKVLEHATDKTFVTAKAYCSVHDTVSNGAKQPARFPHANFTDVIPAQLSKSNFHSVVLQAASVDISN